MRTILLLLLAAIVLAACAKKEEEDNSTPHDGLNPGAPVVLSPTNPAGSPKDEDACIILASNNRFYVAWLSNRDGNDEIYVMSSLDGLNWSAPARVTNNADNDWYPTILEANGLFHICWMRQTATTRTVWYKSSPDGIDWSGTEVPVTTGVSDDFTPHMVVVGTTFHVYFDSLTRSSDATRNLFLVQSSGIAAGSVTSWGAPQQLAISSTTESDQMAYVHPRPLGGFLMTWIRHAGSASAFNSYLDATTDINWASSTDGIAWTYWGAIMPEDGSTDTMPSMYNAGFSEQVTWMRGISATPNVMEFPFMLTSTWPTGSTNITATNSVPGWSPRVCRTLKPNTYLRVWVGASDLRLYYQVFTR